MPRSEQVAAARRSAASSGTVQKTTDEMSWGFPNRIPASWAAWIAWMA